MFLNIAVGDLQDAIRKGQSKKVLGDMLGRIVSRIFCVAEAYKDLPLVEVMACKYPLSHCTYCGKLPCECAERRPDYQLVEHADSTQMQWSLCKWCQGFALIYGPKNSSQNVEVLMCRLFKEVVELASTQARISRTKGSLADIERTLTLELADVMAWTIALANYYGLDLGEFFLFRYGRGCLQCGEKIECTCIGFRMGEIDWGRYPDKANSQLLGS